MAAEESAPLTSVVKKKKKSKSTAESVGSIASAGTTSTAAKKKKKSSSVVLNKKPKVDDAEDNLSIVSSRSAGSTRADKKTKKKKKKKLSKDEADDDASAVSSRSSASTRSKRKKAKDKLKSGDVPDTGPPPQNVATTPAYLSADADTDLFAENEALAAETATLRKTLSDAMTELEKLKAEATQRSTQTSAEHTQLQMDLRRAQTEVSDLKSEIDEYEEAVSEKDSLIKKLTEAVDCQLDKVEYLELKLQRAEEEFCKMEDEMKDMEEEIEELKVSDASQPGLLELDPNREDRAEDIDETSEHSSGSLKEVADDMQRRLVEDRMKRLDLREMELEDRENELYDREQELLDRERGVRLKEQEVMENADVSLEERIDQVRTQELKLEGKKQELAEVEASLGRRRLMVGDGAGENVYKYQGTDELESTLKEQEREIRRLNEIVASFNLSRDTANKSKARMPTSDAILPDSITLLRSEMAEMESQHESLRTQYDELNVVNIGVDELLRNAMTENEKLTEQIHMLNFQRSELEKQVPKDGLDRRDAEIAALEDEIADLREKIVDKEQHVRRQRDDVDRALIENEELKQEMKEMESSLRALTKQHAESRGSSSKKIAQKDETIFFMQNEMLRITKEKQELESSLRTLKNNVNESKLEKFHGKIDDELELAKLQAVNKQLRQLDEENLVLEDRIKDNEMASALKIKEKESRILELEEEITDLKWEMKARKEADYVTLLKDRKDRKKELDATKKRLMAAEDRVGDLELELKQLTDHHQDLENDVVELNKCLVTRDSGDYVSGLKRQVRSLKEHNATLERMIENETKGAIDAVQKREAKILILQQEVDNLKNPTQAMVRGIFSLAKRASTTQNLVKGESVQAVGEGEHESDGNKVVLPTEPTAESPTASEKEPKTHPSSASSGPKLGMKSIWNAISSPSPWRAKPSMRFLGEKQNLGGKERPTEESHGETTHGEESTSQVGTSDDIDLEKRFKNPDATLVHEECFEIVEENIRLEQIEDVPTANEVDGNGTKLQCDDPFSDAREHFSITDDSTARVGVPNAEEKTTQFDLEEKPLQYRAGSSGVPILVQGEGVEEGAQDREVECTEGQHEHIGSSHPPEVGQSSDAPTNENGTARSLSDSGNEDSSMDQEEEHSVSSHPPEVGRSSHAPFSNSDTEVCPTIFDTKNVADRISLVDDSGNVDISIAQQREEEKGIGASDEGSDATETESSSTPESGNKIDAKLTHA